MSRLRIYALFGDGGQHAGRVSVGPHHELHFSRFGPDELVERIGVDRIRIRTDVLDQVLGEMESFDAVFSDSPELVLLRYVRQRRSLRPLPWLVNEVDRLQGAAVIARFIRRHYGEDPLPEALAAPEVLWFTILPEQEAFYRARGLEPERLSYLPMSRAAVAFFFPEDVALQERLLVGDGAAIETPVPGGCLLALGSHERDHATLAATGLRVHVICNLALYPDRPAGPLTWHDSQPPDVYLESVRRAAVIILPLRTGARALGQLSCVLPMRLGRAIVATDVPSLVAHVEPGRTGMTVPLGDVGALRAAISRLQADPAERDRLGRAARTREAELSACAAASLERLLARLHAAG